MIITVWIYIIGFIIIIDIIGIIDSKIRSKYKIIHCVDYDILHNEILSMNGRQFELFCGDLFSKMGHSTKITQATNDNGKDIILDRNTYVECKAWHENLVGREVLQKLIGACVVSNINKAIVICTSGYNKNAVQYAKSINKSHKIDLQLWTDDNLMYIIKDLDKEEVYELIEKYN